MTGRAYGALQPLSKVGERRRAGGEGGIRTPDRLAPMPHFECGAFNHSATSPGAKSGLSPVIGAVIGDDGGPDKARGGKNAHGRGSEAERCGFLRSDRGPEGLSEGQSR